MAEFKEKELQKQREAEKEARAQKKGVGHGAGKYPGREDTSSRWRKGMRYTSPFK